jgi:hypothetical protein
MKHVWKWIVEERIAILILLLAIGIVLNSPPTNYDFGAFLLYAVIIIVVFHLAHRLYLKYKR